MAEDVDKAAWTEFARTYAGLVGLIIYRMNKSWISEEKDLLSCASWKVLDLVQRDLASQMNPAGPSDEEVKKRVREAAEKMALFLWRHRHSS
ncbi:MAG: hypothetical protein HYX92_00020 [Chloroflexi bacterium]|nr:hypothetical protein [Chloroflexota bacterium]